MKKGSLWMFMADMSYSHIHLVIPTLAWMASRAGAEFECYLESERDGRLFARTGSTILGGSHHQQFNYLNAVFDVRYILFGETTVFRSSIDAFGAPIMAETDSLLDLYQTLLAIDGIGRVEAILFAPESHICMHDREFEIGPYLFPEIYYRQALAMSCLLRLVCAVGCMAIERFRIGDEGEF